MFFFLVVMAPVTEELMFRGLFLHRLSESHGRIHAILGSALFFGVFHLLPWQVIGATLIGIYLGWLVTRTGSILMPIAAHAFFNLVPVAATGLSDHAPIARGLGAGGEEFRLTPGLLVGAALALAAGILGTLRTTRQRGAGCPSGPPPAPAGPPRGPSPQASPGRPPISLRAPPRRPSRAAPGYDSVPGRQEWDARLAGHLRNFPCLARLSADLEGRILIGSAGATSYN